MQLGTQKMLVRSGSKRRLRRLRDIEVEVLPSEDNSSFVKCRRCDDGKVIKLRKDSLVRKSDLEVKDGSVEQKQQAIGRYQRELLDMEDVIPWNGVNKAWKGKRNRWRKRISVSCTLQDIGEGLKELLRCLVWGREYRIVHCPLQWENEIDDICGDGADFELFAEFWKKLSLEIRQWIQDRNQPGGMHFISHEFSKRAALLAFHKLKEASSHGDDALHQVPLADIINHDPIALSYLKEMLLAEKGKNIKSTDASQMSLIKTPKVGNLLNGG